MAVDKEEGCAPGSALHCNDSAHTGASHTKWLPYALPARNYLHITPNTSDMRTNLRAEKVAFWNILIPKLKGGPPLGMYSVSMEGSVGEDRCQLTVSIWVFLAIVGVLLAILLLLTVLYVRTAIHHSKYKKARPPHSAPTKV